MGDRQPIPFADIQQSGADELGGGSPAAINVVVAGGVVRRRPGLVAYDRAPSTVINADGVSAVYTTVGGDLYVVGGDAPQRHIYRVTATGVADLSAAHDGDFRGSERPVIAETESILAFAGGDRAQKVVLATLTSSPLANAPEGTHVIANASRLLINDPDTRSLVDFSDLAAGSSYAGFEVWGTGIGTAGFFSAEAKPDPIAAIAENGNEVWVFGTTSLQVFAPDATTTYAPVVAQEVGCAAPYSVVKKDGQFAWLDHMRRIVTSDGRGISPISGDIQQTLNDLETIDDCFGFRFLEGAVDVLVWVFPTDQRAFAYQEGAGWGEWLGWSSGTWAPLPISSHHLRPGSAVNVVGTTDGRVLALRNGRATDLETPINAQVTTGFLNRGSSARKACKVVRLTLRRGQTTGADEPRALLEWRNDLGPWEPPIEVSLGVSGDAETVVSLYSLGTYRLRQWRFTFTGTEDLVLVSASEEFEDLGG